MNIYPMRMIRYVNACLLCFALSASVSAEEDKPLSFARDVLPVLSNKCFVCHGPDTGDEGLVRLDSEAAATADLGGYRAVDPNDTTKSEVLQRIHSEDDPMPPEDAEKKLTDEERDTLTRWIKSGGKYEKHWAFVPPVKVTPPQGQTNPVDAFVMAQLTARKLKLAGTATRETLARRVALVLTGLPPEPDELNRFLGDSSDKAYSRYVNRMLSSPRFGEHQARYWLDAVRYGDTHGLHLDNRRGIYPYRDWVVRAMNQNLPLDDFIKWQLAGDLLPSPTLQQLVATGFVRMNPSTSEGGAIPAEFQAKNNFDRVENLGTVLLGMTLTCARCHTHKYDPITQQEYYRLLAFFNSTAESAMDGNAYTYKPVIEAPADQAGWERLEALQRRRAALLDAVREAISENESLSDEVKQEWQVADVAARLEMLTAEKDAFADIVSREDASNLQGELQELEKSFTTTLVAKELAKPRKTQVLHRGEYDQPQGEVLQPGVLSVMGDFPVDASRNRLGLAEWLTARGHPLVARVIVNRIWQRVFGHGLVRTPEDFGLQGEYPTHPELLDWLAVELQDSGWNLKHMLRLMINSRTFRQSSAWRVDIDDPENRLYARGPGYRLDAEIIRDLGLWASQLLDSQMGGEGVKPYQPVGMWKALAHPASNTKEYKRDSGNKLYRRSLYVYWKRTSPHPMMTLFDAPDREASCVRRSRTNTPLQSLGLLNETQRIEMARKFAERLLKNGDSDEQRFDQMFRLVACRPPSEIEKVACEKLLETMRRRYRNQTEDAKRLLAIGEIKRDKTLKAAEVAAWTQVAGTFLASDLALLLY